MEWSRVEHESRCRKFAKSVRISGDEIEKLCKPWNEIFLKSEIWKTVTWQCYKAHLYIQSQWFLVAVEIFTSQRRLSLSLCGRKKSRICGVAAGGKMKCQTCFVPSDVGGSSCHSISHIACQGS